MLALATWLVSGRTVWLLPNVMSEELPISQIFKPLVSVTRPEEGKGRCGRSRSLHLRSLHSLFSLVEMTARAEVGMQARRKACCAWPCSPARVDMTGWA